MSEQIGFVIRVRNEFVGGTRPDGEVWYVRDAWSARWFDSDIEAEVYAMKRGINADYLEIEVVS